MGITRTSWLAAFAGSRSTYSGDPTPTNYAGNPAIYGLHNGGEGALCASCTDEAAIAAQPILIERP